MKVGQLTPKCLIVSLTMLSACLLWGIEAQAIAPAQPPHVSERMCEAVWHWIEDLIDIPAGQQTAEDNETFWNLWNFYWHNSNCRDYLQSSEHPSS